jgi:hypothetical protein
LHSTQAPVLAHAGSGGLAVAQRPVATIPQGTHLLPLQKGAVACLQSASATHSTQAPLVVLQTGVAPVHAPVPAVWQPTQASATQKGRPGLAAH